MEDRLETWQQPNVKLVQTEWIDFEIEREINDEHHCIVIYSHKSGIKQDYWLWNLGNNATIHHWKCEAAKQYIYDDFEFKMIIATSAKYFQFCSWYHLSFCC